MSAGQDGPSEPGRGGRGRIPGRRRTLRENDATDQGGGEGPNADRRDGPPRGMERLGDLLPRTAREYGLEDQLDQAAAAAAWDRIVADRVPAAVGACRLIGLSQGVATIQIDMPIVAQEIRLRSPELLAALREVARNPIRQLHLTTRHV